MDSPWLDPRFLAPTIIVLVGAIIWLVRLEGKVNSVCEDVEAMSGDLDKLRTRFYEHVTNLTLHHNEQAVNEFRTALERRFSGVESSLEAIKGKLERMAAKTVGS